MMTKLERLHRLTDDRGVIAALAIDQRSSLQHALSSAMGRAATARDLEIFKSLCVDILTPYASAVLLDPEFGLPALQKKSSNTGLLLSYEKTGYDSTVQGRLPALLEGYSVGRLRGLGADAVKLLVYYDPYDSHEVNGHKKNFVRQVGDECRREDMPFFLELVTYSDAIGDTKSFLFAQKKPELVMAVMREFSDPSYGVDVLKIEFPFNIAYVGGSSAHVVEDVAYSRDEVLTILRQAAQCTSLPFIYLSAGVSIEAFVESLALVREAGVFYHGVLCGRAIWQEGIAVYGRGGEAALRSWLLTDGVAHIQRVNAELARSAVGLFGLS